MDECILKHNTEKNIWNYPQKISAVLKKIRFGGIVSAIFTLRHCLRQAIGLGVWYHRGTKDYQR